MVKCSPVDCALNFDKQPKFDSEDRRVDISMNSLNALSERQPVKTVELSNTSKMPILLFIIHGKAVKPVLQLLETAMLTGLSRVMVYLKFQTKRFR